MYLSTQHERTLHLQVISDMICPWCFNGKRSLDQALEVLAGQGVDVEVEWLPYQLNPTMPAEGMDRKEFRTMRFGWENALARLAYAEGGAALQGRVVDALFTAYFTDGKDISDEAVLERIADEAGMQPGAVQRSLPSYAEVRKVDTSIKSMGLSGVPSYLVDGKLLFSGSQDVQGYVKQLTSAANSKA